MAASTSLRTAAGRSGPVVGPPGSGKFDLALRAGLMRTPSANRMLAVHPGDVLLEDCLVPLGSSVNVLALALGVLATRIHEIGQERRGITADAAERRARYFDGDAKSSLALQADYDLKTLSGPDDIARNVLPRQIASAKSATSREAQQSAANGMPLQVVGSPDRYALSAPALCSSFENSRPCVPQNAGLPSQPSLPSP